MNEVEKIERDKTTGEGVSVMVHIHDLLNNSCIKVAVSSVKWRSTSMILH